MACSKYGDCLRKESCLEKKTENLTEGFDWEQKDKDRKVKDYVKNGE
jgi:hypothetical protein